MRAALFLSIALIVGIICGPVYAAGEDGQMTLEQRMIRLEEQMIKLGERMSRLEVMLAERFKAIDQRFEAVNQRFEAVNQRIDDLNAGVNARFNYVYIMLAALIALIGLPAVSRARQEKPAPMVKR